MVPLQTKTKRGATGDVHVGRKWHWCCSGGADQVRKRLEKVLNWYIGGGNEAEVWAVGDSEVEQVEAKRSK